MRYVPFALLLCALGCGGEETPDASTLAAPVNVTVTAADRALVVRWDPVPGAHSYDLHWSTTPGVNLANSRRIADVTNPFEMVELTNGQAYSLVVTALGPKRLTEGPPSAEVTGTPAPQPPPTPRNFRLREGNGRIQLDWDNVAAATAYRVYWSDSGEPTRDSSRLDGVARNVWHEGLENGRTYRYMLVALRDGLEGAPTTIIAGVPRVDPVQAPAQPRELRATAHETTVTLTWNAAERATTYDVYWTVGSTVTKESGIRAAGVASPWTHERATPGVRYAYLVVATNTGGDGPSSDVATATPELPAFAGTFANHDARREIRAGALELSASEARLVDGRWSYGNDVEPLTVEAYLGATSPGATALLETSLPLRDGGTIRARVGLEGTAPHASVRRCSDDACANPEEISSSDTVPTERLSSPTLLVVVWDEAASDLLLQFGEDRIHFDLSAVPLMGGSDPSATRLSVAGDAGASATFDNVSFNGRWADTEDFSLGTLDPVLWAQGEATTTSTESLQLSQRTRGREESITHPLALDAAPQAFQATIATLEHAGNATAGIEAVLAAGAVSSVVVTGEGAFAVIERCTDAGCTTREELQRARIGAFSPGDSLLVWRTGADFVFRAGSAVTTWTATEIGLAAPTAPTIRHAALRASVSAPIDATARVAATFEHLRIW